MFKMGLVILVFVAVLLIYLSNKQQLMLSAPLNKNLRYLGYALLLAGLGGWLTVLSASAAFFLWLMLTINALMLLPLSCYLLSGRSENE